MSIVEERPGAPDGGFGYLPWRGNNQAPEAGGDEFGSSEGPISRIEPASPLFVVTLVPDARNAFSADTFAKPPVTMTVQSH